MTASGQLRLPVVLRRRAGEVDLDLVAGDRDGDADLELAVDGPRARRRRLEAAVGEAARSRRGRRAPSRRGARPSPRDAVAAAALAELGDPLARPAVRRELRAEVAAALVGVPHLRDERVQRRLVEPRRRDHDALLLERAGRGGHAAGLDAADVGVVRARRGEAERGARDERDVGQVRAAGVRVVEDEDVVGRRVAAHHGGDGVGHRAEVDGDVLGLRDHPAALVEERRRAVAPLLDVRREGRADEHGAHLLGDRAQRAAEHLELDVHVGVLVQPQRATVHP